MNIYMLVYAYICKYIYVCMTLTYVIYVHIFNGVYTFIHMHMYFIYVCIMYVLELRIVCPAKTCQQISGNSQCSSGMYVHILTVACIYVTAI